MSETKFGVNRHASPHGVMREPIGLLAWLPTKEVGQKRSGHFFHFPINLGNSLLIASERILRDTRRTSFEDRPLGINMGQDSSGYVYQAQRPYLIPSGPSHQHK